MPSAAPTIRKRILTIISVSRKTLTGHEVAKRAGIDYKQAIDALNSLHNADKITRHGRKFTALWGKKTPDENPAQALERALLGIYR